MQNYLGIMKFISIFCQLLAMRGHWKVKFFLANDKDPFTLHYQYPSSTNFSRSIIFLLFNICQTTRHLLSIMFIIDRCRGSSAAMTSVKYKSESMRTFAWHTYFSSGSHAILQKDIPLSCRQPPWYIFCREIRITDPPCFLIGPFLPKKKPHGDFKKCTSTSETRSVHNLLDLMFPKVM